MKDTKDARIYFSVPVKTVMGDPENEISHVMQRGDNFLTLRKIPIKGLKQGRRLDICQVSDVHFNCLNGEDFLKNDPCVMSSYEHRLWNRGGASLQNAIRAFEYGSHCDAMVVTGDILDYHTYGALEYTKKYLWDAHPDAIACLGGHDVLCRMQGEVEDTMPLAEKYKNLSAIWGHDILYYARVLDARVMLVQMNNDLSSFTSDQYEKLSADIEKARRESLTVLLFMHEPLSTGNPADTEVSFIRTGDALGNRNFYSEYAGSAGSDEPTMRVYRLITESADVIKGIFCGHCHSDIYTEVLAYDPQKKEKTHIPQHTLIANCYTANTHPFGSVLHIVMD